MIDTSRWTANERAVLRSALITERDRLRSSLRRSRSPIVRSDSQWRLIVVGEALDAIGDV